MKNLPGFLITVALLFSPLLFPNKIFAKVNPTSEISYTVDNKNIKTNIDVKLTNTSSQFAVVNYINILLPYKSISDISVRMPGRSINSTSFKKENGLEISVNLNNLVIKGNDFDNFTLSFVIPNDIDSSWGYAKLTSRISGLKVSKVYFSYDVSRPPVSIVNGAKAKLISSNKYEFCEIKSNYISINFGTPVTFEYQLNKTYINEGSETVIQEIVLPTTDSTQQFIIEEISPTPAIKRIDTDGNIILGFEVSGGKQVIINIKGHIIKNAIDDVVQTFQDKDLITEGYWKLTNQFENQRLDNFLKDNNLKKNANNIALFVIDRLKIQPSLQTSTNSFENIQRIGADGAISRKTNAIAEDYVDLLIALLRENSIPARMIVGYLPISHELISDSVYHTWVEYFDLTERKWKGLDPSLNDLFNIKSYVPDNDNTIKLLIRSEHYNQPKLPFLSQQDLKIKPVANSIKSENKILQNENEFKNDGNSIYVLEIVANKEKIVLLPEDTYKVNTNSKIIAYNLEGKIDEFNVTSSQAVSSTSFSLLSELILFWMFIAIVNIFHFIYVKIWHGK